MPFERIGIVGMGAVGTATKNLFATQFEVVSTDRQQIGYIAWTTPDVARHCDGPIFVCVPTPPHPNGRCDTSIVEEVVAEINEVNLSLPVIIKSTIPPGTVDMLAEHHPDLAIAHQPELVTDRFHNQPGAEPPIIVLGGDRRACKAAEQAYLATMPEPTIIFTEARTAELLKYARNVFFALKITYANELARICKQVDVDYDDLAQLLRRFPWCGTHHWSVPGPDGERGFGGKCLPKDLAALLTIAGDCPPPVLAAIEKSNAISQADYVTERKVVGV